MRRRWCVFLIYVALSAATIVAFEPVRHNGFVNYDDYEYVTKNPQVSAGISHESVIWAFTSSQSANWHPLTWLSHMLDCELFDLDPLWHHLTSVLFHLANTLLLFWILKEMTRAVWPSAFVAAVFALHPVHVESVAWVAERKDVLSGFFWMLTIAAYIRYAKRPRAGRYLLVVSALCMGLMSKPMVVTLPFVLLLLDYWPLGRFRWESETGEKDSLQSCSARHLIVEKTPLFILVVVVSVITFIFQQSAGAMKQEDLPLNFRITNALVTYARYVGKMVFPSRLAVLYPLPVDDSLSAWQPIVSFIILACISMGVIFTARRYRYLVVGWLWYLGTLVPVIGLVRVGSHAMADRYTYLPSIGFFIMVGWGAAEIFARWRYRKIALGITASLVLAVLLVCTRVQVGYWKNSLTLFGHTLEVTENNYVINKNYGNVLYEKDRFDEAVAYYQESLRIAPFYLRPRLNMGKVFLKQGKLDKAIECFNDLLKIKSDYADAHFNLAKAIMQQGESDGVVEHFNEALQARPNWPEVYYNLGLFYARQGKYDLAIQNYREALKLSPDYPEAVRELIVLLKNRNNVGDAVEGREEIPEVEPDNPYSYFNVAIWYARKDKYELAVEHYNQALKLKPDWVDAMNNLAWVLATAEDMKFRNPAKAVKLAERACELTGYEQADLLDTLSVAYASAGKFSEAVETAEKAISLAKDAGQEGLADEIQSRLQLYKAGHPYIKKSSVPVNIVQ